MDWRVGKDRKRKAFAHYKLAKSEAEVIANELSRGEAQYDKLTNEDRMIYSRAYKSIKGISKPLDLIANEYSEAINQLQGIPIQQAVEYYLKERFKELGIYNYSFLIHFGLASQDINNTAITYSLRQYIINEYIPRFFF